MTVRGYYRYAWCIGWENERLSVCPVVSEAWELPVVSEACSDLSVLSGLITRFTQTKYSMTSGSGQFSARRPKCIISMS